jgi:hypothetical protein
MKFLAIILTFVPTLALAEPAAAQSQSTTTKSYYDNRGSFAGQSWTRGNTTSFSDGQGRFSGSSVTRGNSTHQHVAAAMIGGPRSARLANRRP